MAIIIKICGIILFILVVLTIWQEFYSEEKCGIHNANVFPLCQECVDKGYYWNQYSCSYGKCANESDGWGIEPYGNCEELC